MAAADLLRLLERTEFAVAKESTRYAFSAVLLRATPKTLTAAATDGRRLARDTAALEGGPKDQKLLVPHKAVTLLLKALKEAEEPVR